MNLSQNAGGLSGALNSTNGSSNSAQVNQPTSQVVTVGASGRVELTTSDQRSARIALRARPLPLRVAQLLDENSPLLKSLAKLNQNKLNGDLKSTIDSLKKLKTDLETEMAAEAENYEFYASEDCKKLVDRIISFGPHRSGPNILVNMDDELNVSSVWSILESSSNEIKSSEHENNLILGFDLAMAKGPICEEPMQGVAVFIEKFQFETELASGDLDISMSQLEISEKKSTLSTGSKSSSLISLMKFVCKRAIEAQPQRLMAAMYKCEAMTVSSEALGKLYAVLGKR